MDTTYRDTVEEINLVVNIFDTLSNSSPDGHLRRDQVGPLTARLRRAAEQLMQLPGTTAQRTTDVIPRKSQLDGGGSSRHDIHLRNDSSHGAGPRNAPAFISGGHDSKTAFKMTKPSSVRAKAVPRDQPPSSAVHISKEVARVITCTMYNILEGTTSLLRASSASIYVRRGDEMVSIANVAQRLTFPPQLIRHRCVGSKDADVLASGIALNQRIHDTSQSSSSVMIFPIFSRLSKQQRSDAPVATIHVENKAQGTLSFDAHDESLLYLTTCLIGELMSRVPQLDWIENFYDPVTQHIVAPFKITRRSTLPPLSTGKKGSHVKIHTSIPQQGASTSGSVFVAYNTRDEQDPIDPRLIDRIENYLPEVMIKRERVPQQQSKPPAYGLTQMPTLREVRTFVDNMQDCWKKNVASNVDLVEADRCTQAEARQLRRDLAEVRVKLAAATEQLRLYQLNIGDYKQEYSDMRAELDMYLRSHDKLRA